MGNDDNYSEGVVGRIVDAATGDPIAGAAVEVFDKDKYSADDPLGATETDAGGRFRLDFGSSDYSRHGTFKNLLEKRPDIYVKVRRKGESKQVLSKVFEEMTGERFDEKTGEKLPEWKEGDDPAEFVEGIEIMDLGDIEIG